MELCNEYLFNLIKVNPTYNDFFSKVYELNGYQPNIYSQGYIDKENKLIDKYYNTLKNKKNKTKCDKILFHELKSCIKGVDFNIDHIPLNYSSNIIFTFILQLSGNDTYYFYDIDDYKNFVKRLEKLPSITNSIINNMKEGIKQDIVQSNIIIMALIKYFNNVLLNNNSPLNKLKLNVPTKYKQTFTKSINKYLKNSIIKINNYLQNNYINYSRTTIGLAPLKNGKGYYLELAKYNTYKNISINKIVNIANKEFIRIINDITTYKNKLKFKGDYNQFKEYILTDKKYKLSNKLELINKLVKIQKDIDKNILPKLFYNINTDISYNIECNDNFDSVLSPYYTQLFKNSKGVMNINNKMIETLNSNELYVLTLHEGNPGHNYEQIINNKEYDYVLFNNYTCYSEGWAFYVEGFYKGDNIYYKIFQSIYELQRVLRLLIDTGIHYYNWSYQTTFYFMKKHMFLSDKSIHNDILRYISDPGQALSYYIGRDIIHHYRKLYLKKDNNIKNFHKLFFDIGPCPMDIFIDEMSKLGYKKYNLKY